MYDFQNLFSSLQTARPQPAAKPAAAPKAPKPGSFKAREANLWKALQDSENTRVRSEFQPLREELQLGFHQRGLSRSGFALEEMANLDAREMGALSQVQMGNTERMLDFQRQQDYLRYMRAQKKAQEGSGPNWLGAALGVAGAALAIPTGGATLPLAATGASMYLGSV